MITLNQQLIKRWIKDNNLYYIKPNELNCINYLSYSFFRQNIDLCYYAIDNLMLNDNIVHQLQLKTFDADFEGKLITKLANTCYIIPQTNIKECLIILKDYGFIYPPNLYNKLTLLNKSFYTLSLNDTYLKLNNFFSDKEIIWTEMKEFSALRNDLHYYLNKEIMKLNVEENKKKYFFNFLCL